MGTCFTKLRLFFRKVSFISNTLLAPPQLLLLVEFSNRGATINSQQYVQPLKKLKGSGKQEDEPHHSPYSLD